MHEPESAGGESAHDPAGASITAVHERRLRAIWRSAGWPCRDLVEAELLVAGLLSRHLDPDGRETLHLTDAGLARIVQTVQRHRGARARHEALVARVARAMQHDGRIVWRGLSLRAPPPDDADTRHWPIAQPDVFSIRHTTREDLVEPVVHEIKVRRSDLLSDLRHEAKREAYRRLSSQCWYVIQAGIGRADEIPAEYGVMAAHPGALEVLRPAPRRPMRLGFMTWMALARARAEPPAEDESAGGLPVAD